MKTRRALILRGLCLLAVCVPAALSQVAFAALGDWQPSATPTSATPAAVAPAADLPPAGRLRSFELPAVTVVGDKPTSDLREEDRVGTYGQPRWTATRRFPGTRVYVIPEHQIEAEFWARPTFNEDGSTETRLLYELEVGLPNRFQVDMYYRADVEEGDYRNGAQLEMRYAFADWGKLWGNPTLYLEYAPLESAPDKLEVRMLFGDEFASRWHWGLNTNVEWETGGEREVEYQISGGIGYTVVDEKFSVGAEGKALFTDVKGDRGDFTDVYLLGPSFQWRPVPQLTINLAPLAGIGDNAPDAEVTFNVGWEF